MKLLVGTAILCMLATAPVYARQNQDDKQQESSKAPKSNDNHAEKPATRSPGKPVDRPSKPPKEAPVRTKATPSHQKDQQQAKSEQKAQQNEQKAQQNQAKNQEKQRQQAEQQAKNRRQDQNLNHGRAETAANVPHGDNGERRIPETRYRADFGRAHTFHVRQDNDRRFQFGGYWFQYSEAWPSDWSYDDNLYIVEVDSVDYLCDARFPDQRIVVVIAA